MIQDQWPDFMLEAWNQADRSQRFTYQINRPLVGFFLFMLVIIWVFFLYTALTVHQWTILLTVFVMVYGLFTAYLLIKVLRWRAFTVMSAVVVGKTKLCWTHGTEAYQAPLSMLKQGRLNLEELTGGDRLEGFLTIDLAEGDQVQLYIYRPYAYMKDLESFMELLLIHIQSRKKVAR